MFFQLTLHDMGPFCLSTLNGNNSTDSVTLLRIYVRPNIPPAYTNTCIFIDVGSWKI